VYQQYHIVVNSELMFKVEGASDMSCTVPHSWHVNICIWICNLNCIFSRWLLLFL